MNSPKGSEGDRSYKAFGWQGITLTVPSDWELAFTRGNYASGYVRLADGSSLRLELRWETSSRKVAPADVVDTYVRTLSGKARKAGAEFSVQRDLKMASPEGKRVECYRWIGDRQVFAMLSRCEECGRTVHVHVLGSIDERLKGVARTVFASLRDHPQGGAVRWSFHDVDLSVPAGLPLRRQGLQTGCIRMLFGSRLTRLEFCRLSLAQVLLGGGELTDWFRKFYVPGLKRRSVTVCEEAVKGHPGLRVEGRPWLLVNPLRLVGRRRLIRGHCWHCEETNRLFVLCFDGPETKLGGLDRTLDRFRCCAQA